jgi:hypothetical protein
MTSGEWQVASGECVANVWKAGMVNWGWLCGQPPFPLGRVGDGFLTRPENT